MSLKDFHLIIKLGEGAYSSVYKVKRIADGKEYALKKVKLDNLSEKEKFNALNEIRILASIRSVNVIQYKQAFFDEQRNSLCIIMEYADNGDLYQKIVEYQQSNQLFSEKHIFSLFIQIVQGLKSLHDVKICHRDLKSANIFLTQKGEVKVGDMNVSKVAKKGLMYTQTGTPYYASPEVWKDEPYDYKSDIWSLGCILYEMATLKPPFRAEDMEGLFKKVIKGSYPKINSVYSKDLQIVIKSLLQCSPQNRPTCDQILQMPQILSKMNEKIDQVSAKSILLQTINFTQNTKALTERLPKPNYNPLQVSKIDKSEFVETLNSIIQSEPPKIHHHKNASVDDIANQNLSSKINIQLPKINEKSTDQNNLLQTFIDQRDIISPKQMITKKKLKLLEIVKNQKLKDKSKENKKIISDGSTSPRQQESSKQMDIIEYPLKDKEKKSKDKHKQEKMEREKERQDKNDNLDIEKIEKYHYYNKIRVGSEKIERMISSDIEQQQQKIEELKQLLQKQRANDKNVLLIQQNQNKKGRRMNHSEFLSLALQELQVNAKKSVQINQSIQGLQALKIDKLPIFSLHKNSKPLSLEASINNLKNNRQFL